MLRALQLRREALWERVDGAIPLESLPASCVAARTVAHDGSGPRALQELLRACGGRGRARDMLRGVCDSDHPLPQRLQGHKFHDVTTSETMMRSHSLVKEQLEFQAKMQADMFLLFRVPG